MGYIIGRLRNPEKYSLIYGEKIDPNDVEILHPTAYLTKRGAVKYAKKIAMKYNVKPVIILQKYAEDLMVLREVIQ